MSAPTVWLVDDDDDLRPALRQSLELDDFTVRDFANAQSCAQALNDAVPDVLVCDVRMPGQDGRSFLRTVTAREPALPVILITGHGDVPMAVASMREGAFDFLEKPFAAERLSETVRRATQRSGPDTALAPGPLLGPSPVAAQLRADFAAMQEAGNGGLIVGPPGSGHNALLVHLLAPVEERGAPMLRINCGNLSAEVAELEIMGEDGALARASNGAVAFETFSLLPDDLRQAIAARIADPRPDDPQVFVTLTASSRVDTALSEAFGGRRIDLPPLSRRREDVSALFVAFARRAAARFSRPLPRLPHGLDSWLFRQTFQDNVAEVQALAERFVLGTWTFDGAPREMKLADRVAAHEKLLIEAELARNEGRIRPTYEALGLSRKGLYDKMKRYGIASEDV